MNYFPAKRSAGAWTGGATWTRAGRGEVALVIGMTLFIAAGCVYYLLGLYFRNAGIRPGITFLEHDLGNLKGKTAKDRIREIIESTYHEPIYLYYRESIWTLRHPQHYTFKSCEQALYKRALAMTRTRSVWSMVQDWLWLRYDPIPIAWKPEIDVEASTKRLYNLLAGSLKTKTYAYPVQEGKVRIVTQSGKIGIRSILAQLQSSLQETSIKARRTIRVKPQEDEGETRIVDVYDESAGFCHVLASKTTKFDPLSIPLKTNIELAFQKLRGTIVNPGDTFSFNAVVGERSPAAGFQEVPHLIGEKVQKEIGRGVSQVASTMYEPILRTGCRIVERYHHIFYLPDVRYVTPGLDIRVVYGSKDFKFSNSQNFPLLVDGKIENGKLTLTLRGTNTSPSTYVVKPGRVINEGHKTNTTIDPSLGKGLEVIEQVGIDAYKVKVFRHRIGKNGRKLREELIGGAADYYLSRPTVIRVGTAARGAIAIPSPTPYPTALPTYRPDLLAPMRITPSLSPTATPSTPMNLPPAGAATTTTGTLLFPTPELDLRIHH